VDFVPFICAADSMLLFVSSWEGAGSTDYEYSFASCKLSLVFMRMQLSPQCCGI
jgi:hypothetical protein